MTEQSSDSNPIAESWDSYWHGAEHGAAYSGGGTSHPTVLSFWDEFFRQVKDRFDAPKIIDIASGSGAVVESAQTAFGGRLTDFICLDVSASAISTLRQKFPTVHGVVANARAIPLGSERFDVATSQFGIEYAGLDAIDEVLRLIAADGQVALLLHHRAGGIYRQCAASLEAVEKMQDARFIPYSIAVFEEELAVRRGADRAKYEAAAKQYAPALRVVESIMRQYGQNVADGAIVRLYKDVRTVHSRLIHYDPSEIFEWLTKLQKEVHAYAGRMASMCDSAIDGDRFSQLCEKVRDCGFTILRGEPLIIPDREIPLAWVLVAEKK